MYPDGIKLILTDPNLLKLIKINLNESNWIQRAQNGSKAIFQIGLNGYQLILIDPDGFQ